ncbi:MAG: hypothetical protein J6B77_02400, partial [Clostridia bacterium]|nr:hypothetical protein [Clostridia bacterium]
PITFEKRETEGGGWCYYWEDPDFVIPPPPPENLPPRVRMEKTAERCFGLRYTRRGNSQKFLDVCVVLAPLANFEKGSAAWLLRKG